jgi:hypothetical protein
MHNGIICRIIGVTYSHPEYRGSKPFYSYHLMPEGKFSLKDSIQYQTVDKLAFDPPVILGDGSKRVNSVPDGTLDSGSLSSPALQWNDQLGTYAFIAIDDAPYLELVKG